MSFSIDKFPMFIVLYTLKAVNPLVDCHLFYLIRYLKTMLEKHLVQGKCRLKTFL